MPAALPRIVLRRRVGLALLPAALLAVALALPAAGRAATDEGLTPVTIVFDGNGTFTVDQTYEGGGCTVATHDVMTLGWRASYTSLLSGVDLAGTLGALTQGPGTFSFTARSYGGPIGCSEVAPRAFPACSGAIPAAGPAPAFTVSAGDAETPLTFQAQSLTKVGSGAGCAGNGAEPVVERDLSVFGTIVPGALTASATIPAHGLDTGSYMTHVSSANATPQAPADCVASGASATGNQSCTSTLDWSGTVRFTLGCGRGRDVTVPFPCMKKREKDEARAAAAKWRAIQRAEDGNAQALGCDQPAGTVNSDAEIKNACAVHNIARGAAKSTAELEERIANDPPDGRYGTVPKPHALRLASTARLARRAPHFVALMRRYAQADGLMTALTIAQNRASGAFLAIGRDPSARADAVAQGAAVRRYAKQAAAILRGQARLASRAARELRALGPHARVAAVLLGGRTRALADRLAASALAAIARD